MAVELWGHGKPDYFVPTISSRPSIIDIYQERWLKKKTYTIAAISSIVDVFYTVPTGKKLSLGSCTVSSKNSAINNLTILADSEPLIYDFRFDVRGDLLLSSLSGQEIPEGDDITVYLYNNDTLEGEFALTLSGVLELA